MVDRANHSEGVLIDFDIAARVDAQGLPVDRDELPPAGTLQFRAADLVRPERPYRALYRHDLESFFYALLWIQLHYQDGVYSRHPRAGPWEFGFLGSWSATRGNKRGLFDSFASEADNIPSIALRDEWLVPLLKMFADAFDAPVLAAMKAYEVDRRPTPIEEETFGGALTFENFMAIINSN